MILLLITGGTLDKEYRSIEGKLSFSSSFVPRMLKLARSKADIRMLELFLKDSLDFSDLDRQSILSACISNPEKKIVLTHGTDTLVETAQLLALEKSIQEKTIVLCGAMIPFSMGDSDAMFNLGSAITAVQLLKPGVYVTMNGLVFPAKQVKKNKEKGQFEGNNLKGTT